MSEISSVEGGSRIHLRGMLSSVSCTPPKGPALGKPKFWCKSRYPPLHMLALERRARGLSATDSRRLSEVGRREFVREASEHPGARGERARNSGCMGIRLD